MWGGRFESGPADAARAFTRSFPWDRRLYREDIVASRAHAAMLGARGIIDASDAEALTGGLDRLLQELDEAGGPVDAGDEDIHSYVERVLIERLGDPGRRLHTARSRNDQVATDMRLYVKGLTLRIGRALADLMAALVERAEPDTVAPGFTHLQSGQPVTQGHYLLAIHEMLSRDLDGCYQVFALADVCPLGSGALAGVPYDIDREQAAHALHFSQISRNSMDAVADRDYLLGLLNLGVGILLHLSRWAEDLVIWASPGYAMVEFDDAYATGSSIMPQKKNPDIAELVRGRAGTALGIASGMAATVKGVPLTYGLDLQEDKQALFRMEDLVLPTLEIMREAFATIRFDRERMAQMATAGYATATEIADYLVEQGAPFREAHEIAGRVVSAAIAAGVELVALTDHELQAIDGRLCPELRERLTAGSSVARRDVPGGTAPRRVSLAIDDARRRIELERGRLRELAASGLPVALAPRD
ncbi:MAG: argininosuccinate lyase [Chloroflexi bacterium]|nr:argininosuccinate lyase [Chloroflexota bacterium]